MWDLPRPGLEPVSPALTGGFLTTVPPGKPPRSFSYLSKGLKTLDKGLENFLDPGFCTDTKQMSFITERETRNSLPPMPCLSPPLHGYKAEFGYHAEEKERRTINAQSPRLWCTGPA